MNAKIHSSAIVEQGAKIGEGTKIWHHVHVRENAEIGSNCIIGKNAYIDTGVKIGNNVKIQNNACIYSGTTVEDDVFIGPGAIFTNDRRPRAFIWNDQRKGYIIVKKGASLGAGAIVICGTREKPCVIGEYSMIGAGSVVKSDVAPHALVIGNPAILAGWVCTCGEKISEKEVDKCKGGKCLHLSKK